MAEITSGNHGPSNNVQVYIVKIIREPGRSLVSGNYYDYAEEELKIWAFSAQNAYLKSQLTSKLTFDGLRRRTFINGEEYFNEEL